MLDSKLDFDECDTDDQVTEWYTLTMTESQSASFPCDVNEISPAAEWTESTAVSLGAEGKAALRLSLIVEELFANTIHHGNAKGDDQIHVSLQKVDGAVTMTYADTMSPFDPLGIDVPEAPDLDSWPIGGLGLRLIRNFSSRASYQRRNNQNVTTIQITA